MGVRQAAMVKRTSVRMAGRTFEDKHQVPKKQRQTAKPSPSFSPIASSRTGSGIPAKARWSVWRGMREATSLWQCRPLRALRRCRPTWSDGSAAPSSSLVYGLQLTQSLTVFLPVLPAAVIACRPVSNGPCTLMSSDCLCWLCAFLQLHRCTIAVLVDACSLTTNCI